MLRRAAELRHHDDQRVLEHAAVGQVVDQRGERPVELAELLEVEIEVLVVRVVVGVRDLHERHARVQQPPRQQAVPAEIVLAVALLVLRRLLGDVEHLAPLHQLRRLLVGVGVGVGVRRAAAHGEVVVDPLAQQVAALVGRLADRLGPRGVLRRLAVAQRDAGILGPQIGRVVAGAAATARRDVNVARQRIVLPATGPWPPPRPRWDSRGPAARGGP